MDLVKVHTMNYWGPVISDTLYRQVIQHVPGFKPTGKGKVPPASPYSHYEGKVPETSLEKLPCDLSLLLNLCYICMELRKRLLAFCY